MSLFFFAAAANNTVAYLPSQSAATTLVSTAPSMNGLLAGTYDGVGGTANRNTLRASLVAFERNLSLVPNLVATSELLGNISNSILSFRSSRIIDQVDAVLVSSNSALAAVPSATQLSVVLRSIQDTLNSLSLAGLQSSITAFSVTLSSLPSSLPIRVEVCALCLNQAQFSS